MTQMRQQNIHFVSIITIIETQSTKREIVIMLKATNNGSYLIRILDQQHSSWQGTVTWLSNNITKPFRSTMELILMIDEALDEEELGAKRVES